MRFQVDQAWRRLVQRLVPPCCQHCEGLDCPDGVDLCRHCTASLPWSEEPWQPAPAPLQALFAPWQYAWPLDRMVRSLKFEGERVVARTLGALLAHRRAASAPPPPAWLVPVPLHPARLRERGFNQADEIARSIERELRRVRLPSLLVRTRDTPAQSLLPAAARRVGPRGAFACSRPLAGESIALIDDVVTTGSTAAAAALALHAAGAGRIELWALAQARRERRPAARPAATPGASTAG